MGTREGIERGKEWKAAGQTGVSLAQEGIDVSNEPSFTRLTKLTNSGPKEVGNVGEYVPVSIHNSS